MNFTSLTKQMIQRMPQMKIVKNIRIINDFNYPQNTKSKRI